MIIQDTNKIPDDFATEREIYDRSEEVNMVPNQILKTAHKYSISNGLNQ